MTYRILLATLALGAPLCAAPADAGHEAKELAAYLSTLPTAQLPGLTEQQALALVAMPLSCLDHPQAIPEQRVDYLWVHDGKPHIVDAYDKNRAFYGCFDWHSAVNST